MPVTNVNVKNQGQLVTARLFARTPELAAHIMLYCTDNTPEGYYLVRACMARRPKGGRARIVTLYLEHTGSTKPEHAPEPDEDAWLEILEHEIAIGSARG